MAKNDYYYIVFHVLTYLYNILKDGEPLEVEKLSAETLCDISEKYRVYIFKSLQDEGYIKGIKVYEKTYIDGSCNTRIDSIEKCEITPKGIEYLNNNSNMNKVNKIIGVAVDYIPIAKDLKKIMS